MKSTKLKQNALTKLGIGMAAAVLGMMSGANLVQNVSATSVAPKVSDKTAKIKPTATSTSNNQLGFWTGTDGGCTWQYDILTNTLTVSGAKGAQLSSTPFTKEFKWAGSIEHIVFENPIQMALDSKEKFANLRYLSDIKGLENADTSEVTDMSGLFAGDAKLTSLDISKFDTGKVTDMSSMFFRLGMDNATATAIDLSKLNTANVTTMNGMFAVANLKKLDLKKF